jgi:hypothetical protein
MLNEYRIDYFSKRLNAYTSKIVKASSYDEAIKKSRIKEIEEVSLVPSHKEKRNER